MMWRVVWLVFLPWICPFTPPEHPPSPMPLPPSRFIPLLYSISRSPKGTIKPVISRTKHKQGRRSLLIDDRQESHADPEIGNKSLQLAAALRRQLMQDNYDYMPSDSAAKETEERVHNKSPPRAYNPTYTTNPTTSLSTQYFRNTFDSLDFTTKSTYSYSTPQQSFPRPSSSSLYTPRRPYSDDPSRRPYSNEPYPRNDHHRVINHRDADHEEAASQLPWNLDSEERTRTILSSRRPPGGNFYETDQRMKTTPRAYHTTTSSSILDSFITLFDKDTWKMKNRQEFDREFFKKKENVNTNIFNSFEKQATQRMAKKDIINYYDRYSSTKKVKKPPKADNWEVFREPLDNLQDNNYDYINGSRYNTGYSRHEETTTSYSTARWGNGPNHPYPHIDLTKKSRDTDSEKDYEQYLMKKLEPIMVMSNKANDNFNRKFDTLVSLDTARHELKDADSRIKNGIREDSPASNIDHIHLGNRKDVSKKGKIASFETGLIQRARDPDYESPTYINNKLNQALKSRVTMNINEHRDTYHLLKNTTDETKVNHADLLYYVDDTRLSDPKKLTFHADTPLNREAKIPETRRSNVVNDKSYKMLKLKNDNRRMGGERRFIQEEGVEGVSIVKVDPGPFPEFLLPGDRRQYMRHGDLSDSDPDPDMPDSSESIENTLSNTMTSSTVKTSLTSVKIDLTDPYASEISVE